MGTMETLVANLVGNVRRETMQGRDYIVAPLSLIVPGVLSGNQGPLFYPEDEIGKNVEAWNGVPIVVDHPYVEGKPVSARSPEILNKQGIGVVLHAQANGRLMAEGWFDVENTKRVDNRILQALQAGKKLELSTGLSLDAHAGQGTHNGRDYDATARNYRPDHLAVFADKIGACSLNDGCGVNVNEEKGVLTGIRDTLNRVWNHITNKSSSEETQMQKPEIINSIIANCGCWTEKDREILNGFSEEKLKALDEVGKQSKATTDAINAAGIKLENGKVLVGNGTLAVNAKGDIVVKGEDGKETTVNASTLGKVASRRLLNEFDDEELDEEMKKRMEAKGKKTDNAAAAPKPIQLADLPADLQEDIKFARNAKQQRKNELINRLVANHEKDKQPARRDALNKLSLAELEDRIADLPAVETVANEGVQADYFAASLPVRNADPKIERPEPLGLPVWNFDPEPVRVQQSA